MWHTSDLALSVDVVVANSIGSFFMNSFKSNDDIRITIEQKENFPKLLDSVKSTRKNTVSMSSRLSFTIEFLGTTTSPPP
jgi:hypothetical protein